MTHPIFDEPDEKPNYAKIVILSVIVVVCLIFAYRIYNAPPLHSEIYVVDYTIMRGGIFSTVLYVDKETKVEKSDLNLPVWIVLGDANYNLVNTTVIGTRRMTWEEYQNDK